MPVRLPITPTTVQRVLVVLEKVFVCQLEKRVQKYSIRTRISSSTTVRCPMSMSRPAFKFTPLYVLCFHVDVPDPNYITKADEGVQGASLHI